MATARAYWASDGESLVYVDAIILGWMGLAVTAKVAATILPPGIKWRA